MKINEITHNIIGAAIRVHKTLGPGLLESVYSTCLHHELTQLGFSVKHEVPLPIVYDEIKLEYGYRADLIIENKVIVELKSVEILTEVHQAQILTYLKLSRCEIGLLINFNVNKLSQGIRRFIMSEDTYTQRITK